MTQFRPIKRWRCDLENKVRDNIINPPKLSDLIKPHRDGAMVFTCPSMTKPGVSYNIVVTTNNNELAFSCSCLQNTSNNNCKHLNCTINHIIRTYINQMNKFNQMSEDEKQQLNSMNPASADYVLNTPNTPPPDNMDITNTDFDEKLNKLNEALELFGISDN